MNNFYENFITGEKEQNLMSREEILIEAIHTLLCDKPHANRMESLVKDGRDNEYCYYYMEKNLAERWEMADHVYWQEQAENIKTDLRASNPDDALRSVYKVLDMIEKLNELSQPEFILLKRLMNF